MSDDERVTEEWLYVGRYTRKGDKLGAHWIDGQDEDRYFSKPEARGVVGGLYEVVVSRNGEGGVTMHGTPKYLRMSEHHSVEAFRLRDRTAFMADEARKARDRAASSNGDVGALTLEEVRSQMRTNGNPLHRGALLAAVLAYIEN